MRAISRIAAGVCVTEHVKEQLTPGVRIATAAAKAKPQLKGNIDGDLDDVRYAREALDDEYDFMVRKQLPAPPLRCSSKC